MSQVEALFPRVIDATIRSEWKRCPQSFFRRHVQGLTRGREETSIHLHFGGCFASALEAARLEYCDSSDTSDSLHAACEQFIHKWGDFEPQPRTRSEEAKTLAAGLHALQRYFAEWPLDDTDFSIHTHQSKPCVEFSFALPIPGALHPDTGEPLLYCGRFDSILDYGNAVWGEDDKTTYGDPNTDQWRNQWKLRGQFTGYTWGAREYGLPLKGFIIRGIGIQKTDIKLGWTLTPRPDWLVETWLKQLQDDVIGMTSAYNAFKLEHLILPEHHAFGYNFDHSCSDFGGCQFLDLCTSEHPERWLDEYHVSRWNPLDRQDDK